MSVEKLRSQLEWSLGFEECRFTVPHIFLPPRFREISQDRNMILTIGGDMVMCVRWEGSRLEEYHPLNPAAAGHLLKEVRDNMTRYRREIKVFEKFIRENAEVPDERDARPLDPFYKDHRSASGAPKLPPVIVSADLDAPPWDVDEPMSVKESMRQRLLNSIGAGHQ